MNGLVKSLRYELWGTGVPVWAACPALTVSEFSTVGSGASGKTGGWPLKEPTDRVVRGIVRGLDGRRGFVMPTWRSWAIATVASWLSGPFDWLMKRFRPGGSRARVTDGGSRE